MPTDPAAASGSHVMVVAGSRSDWSGTSTPRWETLIESMATAAAGAGFGVVTIRPYGRGADGQDVEPDHEGDRRVASIGTASGPVTVVVDPGTDGRRTFCHAVSQLGAGVPVTESAIAGALYAPATTDPDLIVIAGPPDQLPPSLMWELAYGEFVFTDAAWGDLDGSVVVAAAAEFARRHRRFGGVG